MTDAIVLSLPRSIGTSVDPWTAGSSEISVCRLGQTSLMVWDAYTTQTRTGITHHLVMCPICWHEVMKLTGTLGINLDIIRCIVHLPIELSIWKDISYDLKRTSVVYFVALLHPWRRIIGHITIVSTYEYLPQDVTNVNCINEGTMLVIKEWCSWAGRTWSRRQNLHKFVHFPLRRLGVSVK